MLGCLVDRVSFGACNWSLLEPYIANRSQKSGVVCLYPCFTRLVLVDCHKALFTDVGLVDYPLPWFVWLAMVSSCTSDFTKEVRFDML